MSGVTLEEQRYLCAPSLRSFNSELSQQVPQWEKLEVCPACQSRRLGRFAVIRHLPHSRCRDCGFTMANPIPSDEVLRAFYNSPFYANYRRLESRRIGHQRYFSMSMYTDMNRLAQWLGEDKTISILDYGCGPGSFLAFLRERCGFANVEGLEINRDSIDIGKDAYALSMASTVEELSRSSYDCVLLLEVLEHVPKPDRFLQEVLKLVKPGGRILLTTPAVDNLLGRFYPSRCPHYTAPSHVSLFTTKAMTSLLNRMGLELERLEIDDFVVQPEKLAAGLFYKMDFSSPKHDDDLVDVLYIPNALGRLLGKKPRRDVGRLRMRWAFARLCRVIDRVACRVGGLPNNDHLYVLARKAA